MIDVSSGDVWIPQEHHNNDPVEMLDGHFGCDTQEERDEFIVEEIWVRATAPPPPEERDGEPALTRDPKTGQFKTVPWYEQCNASTWKGARKWWSVRSRPQ